MQLTAIKITNPEIYLRYLNKGKQTKTFSPHNRQISMCVSDSGEIGEGLGYFKFLFENTRLNAGSTKQWR